MSNLFLYKENIEIKASLCHLNDLHLSLSLSLTLCSDGAGRSGTYILIDMVLNKMAKGNDQWLPFHSFCSRWSVALATPKPLIFHRGSRGCIRGWLSWGLERQWRQRQTRRERRELNKEKKKKKPLPTWVIIYVSYRHAVLTRIATATLIDITHAWKWNV